jgi:hypothetical protein
MSAFQSPHRLNPDLAGPTPQPHRTTIRGVEAIG